MSQPRFTEGGLIRSDPLMDSRCVNHYLVDWYVIVPFVSVSVFVVVQYIKGDKKKTCPLFVSPKTFFLLTKSFGCQRKSFRYQTKENFDTCPRSEDLIVTELCHFL